MAAKKKKKKKRRNSVLAVVAKEDYKRFRERTVLPEKGNGSKQRPRIKKVIVEE